MDSGKIMNENSTRKCLLQDKYKDLKLCQGSFVISGATNHYFQDFKKLGRWDFIPEEFETMKNTVCSLCKSPFHNVIHGKRTAVMRHIALEHGFLKREFISEGNMEEEIEFLAKIDRRFNQECGLGKTYNLCTLKEQQLH